MLDTMYILRSNTITTEEQYNELIQTSPVRQKYNEMLTTPHHHYNRAQIDLYLFAEMMVRILANPNEHFSHWCKFDSSSEHEVASIQVSFDPLFIVF